ncbi:hypothetical protein DPMN_075591, partial [Dreissena polymorpha]
MEVYVRARNDNSAWSVCESKERQLYVEIAFLLQDKKQSTYDVIIDLSHMNALRVKSRSYSLEALECAAADVATGALSLSKAAKTYKVPTLHDRMTGNVARGSKWGKGTLLSASQ